MRQTQIILLFVALLCGPMCAKGQFLALSAGGAFSQDLSAPSPPGRVGGPARSAFSNSGVVTVDAGIGFLPFLGGGIHYSFARPELSLRRGDAFGSSALVNLSAHTLTFDSHLWSPEILGFRLYGLAGAGFSRFSLELKRLVEIPFPGGAPENVLAAVFTYGGGIEKGVFPFVRWKLEVRDYVTAVPEELFQPGGAGHRVLVVAGVVIGR